MGPLIFDIKGFSMDDGPGIRTTVFLKGCALSCIWCHNPESKRPRPEIAFYQELCIGCGDCQAACLKGAARQILEGRIDRHLCDACGVCADVCPSTALKKIGKRYSTEELVELILSNKIYYDTSGGGVTFSGGEPALWIADLHEVMKRLKTHNIHIAIQTSGMFDLTAFQKKLLPFIDLIFFDIKFYDSGLHRQYTGKGNEEILKNFKALFRQGGTEIRPRTPLVPGLTATRENIEAIARFLKDIGCKRYELLPFHLGGLSKARSLGISWPKYLPCTIMPLAEEQQWRRYAHALITARDSS